MRMVVRSVALLVATVLYLGLAVWGWGGVEGYFLNPARVVLAISLFLASGVAFFAGGNVSPGVKEDRENRWILVVLVGLGLLSGYLCAYTDRMEFWTVDGDTTRWMGIGLFVLGSALRLWPVFVLGDRFSGLVAIQRQHTLVTHGIYGWIRHPSYLGLIIGSLGWALAFRSGVGVILVVLMLPALLARIKSEERLLHEHFGDEYDAYRARTSRLIPGLY